MHWYVQFNCNLIRFWGVMAGLLACLCWSSLVQAGSEVTVNVTVAQGRLSVSLREADIQLVLAQIAKQVGFTLYADPRERKTISAQFTDVPLVQGIQRLLRLASLNHVMRSAPDATGRIALAELRVFADAAMSNPLVVTLNSNDTEETQTTQADPVQGLEERVVREGVPMNPLLEFLLRRQKPQQQITPSKGETTGKPPVREETAVTPLDPAVQELQERIARGEVPMNPLLELFLRPQEPQQQVPLSQGGVKTVQAQPPTETPTTPTEPAVQELQERVVQEGVPMNPLLEFLLRPQEPQQDQQR